MGNLVRKWFKRISPDREVLLASRWIRPVAHQIAQPQIWHFNRKNVARGVALGLFVGFLLPIGQIVVAALLAATARGNIMVAAAATLITNPLTFPPIYYAAYRIGAGILSPSLDATAETGGGAAGATRMIEMAAGASFPTAIGLLILAALASVSGYALVHLAWRFSLLRQWRRRERPTPGAGGKQDNGN